MAPSLHLAGPSALAIGAVGGVAVAWFLASRANTPFEAARGLRVGWMVWLAGLAGLCEDYHESEELIVPISVLERVVGRLVLGILLSSVIGLICSAVVIEVSSISVGRRLIEEMVATFLVTAGLSALARFIAPAGLTGASVVVVLVASLAADLLLPPSAKIWPRTNSVGFRAVPVAWLTAGTVLIAIGLLFSHRKTTVPIR